MICCTDAPQLTERVLITNLFAIYFDYQQSSNLTFSNYRVVWAYQFGCVLLA